LRKPIFESAVESRVMSNRLSGSTQQGSVNARYQSVSPLFDIHFWLGGTHRDLLPS
jgi:hypothetical protein